MNKPLLLILWLVLSAAAVCGQDLLESPQQAEWAYIFEINNREAERIYQNELKIISPDPLLYALVDSFPTGESYNGHLRPGHYLKASIIDNQIHTEIHSERNCAIRVMNNEADLKIQVFDLQGNPLPRSSVKVEGKPIQFDRQTQSFRLRKSNKEGLLTVEYDGLTNFFGLSRDRNNPWISRALFKTGYRSPAKYIWKPVGFIVGIPVDGVRSLIKRRLRGSWWRMSYWWRTCFDQKDLNGYLITNQPTYRRGDTVHYKAFVYHPRARRLYRKPLEVEFGYWSDRKVIDTLHPYRPGGYEGSFVVTEKLAGKLDQNYGLTLRSLKGRKSIDSDLRIEDYELTGTTFSLSSESESHHQGQPMILKANARDENDLRLADARLDLLVLSQRGTRYFADSIFIPDTLWQHSLDLDPKTFTRIVLPDSIFPPVAFKYTVVGKFHTSDNENDQKTLNLEYQDDQPQLHFKPDGDNLYLHFTRRGIPGKESAILRGFSASNEPIFARLVTTPYKTTIDPWCAYYTAETEGATDRFALTEEIAGVSLDYKRTHNELKAEVINPRNLPFAWHLYRVDRELDAGYGISYFLKKRVRNKDNYYLSLQFLWGGRMVEQNYLFPIDANKVDLKLDMPSLVYPGQTIDLKIAASDYAGRPVAGMDLTALGLTSRFKNFSGPRLVNKYAFTSNHKSRTRLSVNRFATAPAKPNFRPSASALNYNRWKQDARLDRDEFYRFLYPGPEIWHKKASVSDSNSQFSPFVVHEGTVQPIQVIYLDNLPVYFNWNTDPAPYAFAASPGYHEVKLRLNNALVIIDSMLFQAGKRHIFSFDERLPHPHIRTIKRENKLSHYEQNQLHPYIFPYRNTFLPYLAAIRQDGQVTLLDGPVTGVGRNLAGPVKPGYAWFRKTDSTTLHILHEANFEYEFGPQLMKMREVKTEQLPQYLNFPANKSLHDTVLTWAAFEAKWQAQLNNRRKVIRRPDNPRTTRSGHGRLILDLLLQEDHELQVLNTLIVSDRDPDWLRVYAGREMVFQDLERGSYTVVYLLQDDQYIVLPAMKVLPDGFNFYRREVPPVRNDLFGSEFSRALEKWILTSDYGQSYLLEETDYRTIFHRHFSSGIGREIGGRVLDDEGIPLQFATVLAMGDGPVDQQILAGTNTDENGEFSMFAPDGVYKIRVSYGGNTQEVILGNNREFEITMREMQLSLDAVMIRETRQEIQFSAIRSDYVIADLVAKVEGVNIQESRSKSTLVFVDGVKVISGGTPAEYGDIAGGIVKIDKMEPEEAMVLFGEEGRNGAVFITTAAAAANAWDGLDGAKSLRTNFRDYAFWLPRLVTNENGIATAKVQLPDDVTSWNTWVMGLDGKRHYGKTKGRMRSYKPLMARLELPRFLLPGDTAQVLGKSLNYGGDTVAIRTRFEQDGQLIRENSGEIDASLVEKAPISVSGGDSVEVKYMLSREKDSYSDGELRQIPVYRRGVEETKGQFLRLDRDTTFSLQFDPASGPVTVRAEANLLEVLLDESEKLRTYSYQCNEQLASRLLALLTEKSIREQLGEPFKWDGQIRKTIRLLNDRKDAKATWGWWPGNPRNHWVSLHVVRALQLADSLGFETDSDWFNNHPAWVLLAERETKPDLDLLLMMAETNAAADYAKYIGKLDERALGRADRIKLIGLRQRVNLPYSLDSLLAWKKVTAFGNVHWGEGWEAMPASLAAYRVLKRAGGQERLLERIKGYFLEERKGGHWLNTWQSARVLMEILPGILEQDTIPAAPILKFSGALSETVEQYPYTTEISPEHGLQVSKSGSWPVYFTAWQRHWNENPLADGNIFAVRSYFERFDSTSLSVEEGEHVQLVVRVEVKKDAEYVMVEAPIPAGFTYASKPQLRGKEVHREYFREQCAVFCRDLKTGVHEFRIPLVAKFSGIYTLNPAKAEMMYFPVFFGRNGSKRVVVEGYK